jgi:excisionase family DNA binding protein
MKERRLLTIPEAADEIGISRVVLWRLVRKGTLPSIPAGRFRLIDADDLAAFAAKDRKPGRPRRPAPAPPDRP